MRLPPVSYDSVELIALAQDGAYRTDTSNRDHLYSLEHD
jgi:hypothetical protein